MREGGRSHHFQILFMAVTIPTVSFFCLYLLSVAAHQRYLYILQNLYKNPISLQLSLSLSLPLSFFLPFFIHINLYTFYKSHTSENSCIKIILYGEHIPIVQITNKFIISVVCCSYRLCKTTQHHLFFPK